MRKNAILASLAASCLWMGCSQSPPEDATPAPAIQEVTAVPAVPEAAARPIEVPVMKLRGGQVLRDFELHFINHDHDWEVTNDPVRVRVSDSEYRDIPRSKLRGVRVRDIERDERGFVERLRVVYTTDEGEIEGWSFPLGVFAFQIQLSTATALSAEDLARLSVKETGFHLNHEVREVGGRQLIRIPLVQIESLTLPAGGHGDNFGGKMS